MKSRIGSILIGIWLICISPVQGFEARIVEDRLWLEARDVPLQTVLGEIANTGIRVRIDPAINPPISAVFENQDLSKGLDRLLNGLNHVLIWEKKKAASPIRLAEIQVFRPGQKERLRPLRSEQNFDLAKTKDGRFYVKDQILITLDPTADIQAIEKLLAQIGATMVEKAPGTGVYQLRLAPGTNVPQLSEVLSKHPRIQGAEPNYAYPISLPYRGETSPQVDVHIPKALALNARVPIAVLDTGLQPGTGLDEFVIARYDAVNPDQPLDDGLGHGTQMAYIAAGAITPYGVEAEESPGAIIPIRAHDDQGVTTNFTLMRAVDFALENGAKVMSLSWGTDKQSEFLEKTLEYADSQGLILVAAAGNEPTGEPVYPAAYPSVIGVGALTPDGKSWERSNYGSFVSLSAPGFADFPVGYKGESGTYGGTSVSTAFVANRIADYLSENPGAGRSRIFEFLNDNADPD